MSNPSLAWKKADIYKINGDEEINLFKFPEMFIL